MVLFGLLNFILESKYDRFSTGMLNQPMISLQNHAWKYPNAIIELLRITQQIFLNLPKKGSIFVL